MAKPRIKSKGEDHGGKKKARKKLTERRVRAALRTNLKAQLAVAKGVMKRYRRLLEDLAK